MEGARSHWWQSRPFVLTAAINAIVPLLIPALPPLVDLPGHVGRYRILAEAGTGPLAAHYGVRWALIGNLGVDLLVLGLHPLLDVEPAARLIVTLIPLATVLAMLWVAREAHGRLPPAAGFALPLAYAYPFQLGFVNFCLGGALALAGLAWWLRLARVWPTAWRAIAFAPIAAFVWVCHSFAWAMLGLFALGAEWRLRCDRGDQPVVALFRAGLTVTPMALPLLFALFGTDRLAGDTGDWFNLSVKAQWIAGLLRERWKWWDVGTVIVLAMVLWAAVRSPRLRFEPLLGVPALLGFAAFLLLPRLYAGGAGVDMRILPYAVALALLAIRTDDAVLARRLAIGGMAFLLARTIGTTIAFALFAQGQERALIAVPAMPRGAAVLVLVNQPDAASWSDPRLAHIDGLAIARARVFTNGQWALAGQQLVHPLHPRAAPFDRDPSQLVYPRDAAFRITDLDQAVASFDRCQFAAVWLVDFAPGRVRVPDLSLAWSDGRSAVYRVRPARACLMPGPGARPG